MSFGQKGNGASTFEMYSHTTANDSSAFIIEKDYDKNGSDATYIKVASAATTKASLVLNNAMIFQSSGRVVIPNLNGVHHVGGTGAKTVRMETCNGDGGTNSGQTYVNIAFGPKAVCIAAYDTTGNSIPVTQSAPSSNLCTFVALISE